MNSQKEFAVGKHNIGWIDSDLKKRFSDVEFKAKELPTFQKLPRTMTDAQIESELQPGVCELGDVLAFLDGAPEETKDGYWNLFYFTDVVVDVGWDSSDRRWRVDAWHRDGSEWDGDDRVFSPATKTEKLGTMILRNSDALTLVQRLERLEKLFNPELLK